MTQAVAGVAGVLLAAGGGTRLGVAKALVELGGRRLVERGESTLRRAGCAPVVVVLGARAADASPLVTGQVVVNEAWTDGMGGSLRAGLEALGTSGAAAAVVTLVDQPFVGEAAVGRLVQAWRAGALVAVATYGGAPRNPVLLDRRVWDDLLPCLGGDQGARQWLRAHPDVVVAVPCDDVADPTDIDTAEDLEAARLRVRDGTRHHPQA